MISNIVNMFSKAFATNAIQKGNAIQKVAQNNPFANPSANPFVSSQGKNSSSSYAKNKPVQGGYFAGYYNGRANIVGQRLFIEV